MKVSYFRQTDNEFLKSEKVLDFIEGILRHITFTLRFPAFIETYIMRSYLYPMLVIIYIVEKFMIGISAISACKSGFC